MRMIVIAGALALSACQQAAPEQGSSGPTPAFDGIGASETVQFTGTEPFWGGKIEGAVAQYATPVNPDGKTFPVTRFAGLNGMSFSGMLDGAKFDLMVTPGTCSDGMSDRSYPFTATLQIGGETREGCAWTASKPATGGE